MDAKQSYEVTEAGFLFGDYYKKGGSIELNPKQARRFIDEGRITEVSADDAGAHVATGLDAMTKDELIAEADRRGMTVKSSDTKAEILAALKAES